MTRCDRRLQGVRTTTPAWLLGALQRRQPPPDQQTVPLRAVLFEQQDRLSRRVHPRPQSRRLYLHQRYQPMHFRLLRRQPRQNPPQPQRVFTERRPHPVLARAGRVPFVEDEVNDLQHRRQPRAQLRSTRHFESNPRLGQRLLGPYDPLTDGGFRRQEGARNFAGCQPAQQTQGEGDSRLGGKNWMACDQHQPQQVVPHFVLRRRFHLRNRLRLLPLELPAQLCVLALQQRPPPQPVNRPVLACGHQPGARVLRNARLRPLVKGG